jgi:hypothetical protein
LPPYGWSSPFRVGALPLIECVTFVVGLPPFFLAGVVVVAFLKR